MIFKTRTFFYGDIYIYLSKMPSPTIQNSTKKSSRNNVSKRGKSTSPNTRRKTKSTAQQLTEYKIKSHRNRSVSVSGRLPRMNMADDFARGLRADGITDPRKRTMQNYYYPKLPLDMQREVNDWVGPPSPLKDKKKLHADLQEYNVGTRRETLHRKSFERLIRKNLQYIQTKLFELMMDEKMKPGWEFVSYTQNFTYFHIKRDNTENPQICYLGYSNSRAVPLDINTFQIIFDFNSNKIPEHPFCLFTFVPNILVEEFKKIPFKEKTRRKLFDGTIASSHNYNYWGMESTTVTNILQPKYFGNKYDTRSNLPNIFVMRNGEDLFQYRKGFEGKLRNEWNSKKNHNEAIKWYNSDYDDKDGVQIKPFQLYPTFYYNYHSAISPVYPSEGEDTDSDDNYSFGTQNSDEEDSDSDEE